MRLLGEICVYRISMSSVVHALGIPPYGASALGLCLCNCERDGSTSPCSKPSGLNGA